MNESGEISCMSVGGGERGRVEGNEEGSKKGRKETERTGSSGKTHTHTHIHTGARLDMAEHTKHQVQMLLVYVNKEIFQTIQISQKWKEN
jgi:hypothetical protein